MPTPGETQVLIDQRLEKALSSPGRLSPDEALEMANQITERGRAIALDQEQSGRTHEAAILYGKIATAWQQAAVRQTGDGQRYSQSLADYWAERAEATRRRAAGEIETAAQDRLPAAGPAAAVLREMPHKPITRPLSPTGVRPADAGKVQKGGIPSRGTPRFRDESPLLRK